jgi:hypothetical protein
MFALIDFSSAKLKRILILLSSNIFLHTPINTVYVFRREKIVSTLRTIKGCHIMNSIDLSYLFRKASSLYMCARVFCVRSSAYVCVGDTRFLDQFSLTIRSNTTVSGKNYDI